MIFFYFILTTSFLFTQNFNIDQIFEKWADPLDIIDPGLGLKQFPCCGSTHSAINCMLNISGSNKIYVDQVKKISILTNPRRLPHTNNPDPQSPLEAKFSIQYAVARALVDGCVTLDHFEGDAFNDLQVRKIMNCITVGEHPDMGVETDNQFGAEVTIFFDNEKSVSSRIDHQVGRGPSNPMTTNELWEKFEDCSKRALFKESIEEIFDMLNRLEAISTITEFTRAMSPNIRRRKVG